MLKFFDSFACEICGDFESATPKSGSSIRPNARLSVSIIFVILLALSVVFILAKSSQVTIQRYVGNHDKLTRLLSKNAITCPCAQTVPLFEEDRVQFYMLTKTGSGELESVPMNNGSDTFCEKFGMQNIFEACSYSIAYCFGRPGNTGVESSQLVNPALYLQTIISEMQAFCTNRVFYYKLQIQIKTLNCKDCNDSTTYDQLMRSLFAVLKAFHENPYNTSDEYYWDAPSKYYENTTSTPTLLNTKNIAFKMTANYSNFVKACDPHYCDLVTYVKLWRRIVTSVAQVGGVLSIALGVLKFLIWPFLVKLFGLDKKYKASVCVSEPVPMVT